MVQLELHKRKNNPVFVSSWPTPTPPDPPPPPWPPPHFHGHVFEAFRILQGGYHVSFSKECAEIFKTLPNRLTWLDRVLTIGPNPLCTYSAWISHMFVAQPTVHMCFFNFLLCLMMAHSVPNTCQFANPSSHHTTSCKWIRPSRALIGILL